MRTTTLPDERTHALVFGTGDELMASLEGFCAERRITAGHFTAIGALRDATLSYFHWESREYEEIPVDEQVEVLTLAGDVAVHEGEPKVHAHAVLGRRDGSTVGGHVVRAHVRPTVELILVESPAPLRKRHDPESGLALIDPSL